MGKTMQELQEAIRLRNLGVGKKKKSSVWEHKVPASKPVKKKK